MQSNVCLHPDLEAKLQTWIEQRPTPAVLLYGAPGVGKTTLTYRLFHGKHLKVVEFNASHTRSGTSFRKTILPLLCQGGVLEQMNTGKKGGIGVLLDEIDGLSSGEKGGLSELTSYLRAWTPAVPGNPLILISNSLENRSLVQISKLCTTFEVGPAPRPIVESWLQCTLPTSWERGSELSGDLRALKRFVAGLEDETESNEYPEGVLPIAWWCLWNEWKSWVELDIENNEGNLAGLVAAENLPERLMATQRNPVELWTQYLELFDSLAESDRADYWAFFYQCWNLLPFSHSLKLKNLGIHLTEFAPIAPDAVVPEATGLRYTSVLTRQSGMFNAWKLLCELSDSHEVPIRLSSLSADLELLLKEGLKLDRKRRLNNLRFTTATVGSLN
jgi:DNA polymerase III delta prime subunit